MADALAIAKQKVDDFHEQVMHQHRAAMECLDCEEYLTTGIVVYKWIIRAEGIARAAIYEDLVDNRAELIQCIEELYRKWEETGRVAMEWVEEVRDSGHRPDNTDEFLDARTEVIDRIERREWVRQVANARETRFASEQW